MANEIVKYHHELNTIPLRKFSPVEMNLFFSIISRLRDKGDQTVRFSFEQLKDLSDYKATANARFVDDLKSTYEKILSLRFGRRSESGLSVEMFVMFTRFKINGDVDEPYVDIQLFEDALPLLNGLDEWVRYSLQQFNDLQSSYSKTMFRLLKQFRTTGYAYFSKEDFNELLDIPKSYRESDVNKKVLKPIKEELTPLFRGLTIKKKYGKGRGKPVIGYQFSFKAEHKNADDFFKGNQEENRKKLFNIEHNGELTQEEKWRAKDRALGLKIGTHESDFKAQQEKKEQELLSEIQKKGLLEDLQKGFLG
ncbi:MULTISPECIES: replication initiation protein [Lactobacillales]|jgi:plasmid replication initiation protein|uniref:Replication initiation protein n=4 Tax=Enterococcaceae TaxID=81852 RepID=A0AAW8U8V6_9ENTE|nr:MULTISPECIES: replication initiation protein [Lactobacillales]EAE7186006.1 RepB family plasmid replication initiator protein [Listeria monocytogenes]EGO5163517.1 replication initiation protein [Enterococcus faecalis]EGO5843289.1 replication initiation protein [Enterococcus faecalis]EIP8080649.1 replication initiation protein [Enterococcus faecalis]MBO0438199.1 replication initiation protein [Vagococcus fluvialis]